MMLIVRRSLFASSLALLLGAFALVAYLSAPTLRADDKPVAAAAAVPLTPRAAASDMARAALRFWEALTPEQQTKARFDVADPERLNWHFVPKGRNGLPLRDMTEAQRKLAVDLLSAGLSDKGLAVATGIIGLEPVLKDLERGRGPTRDSGLYYYTVFGTPGPAATWGYRVEGHHLSLNFLVVEGAEVAPAPSFFGTNPARIPSGPRQGERLMAAEEDLGRALVKALDDGQRKKAIFKDVAPADILTGNAKQVKPLGAEGLAFGEMNEPQKKRARELVELYAHRLRAELAAQDLARIDAAGWDKVVFAWAGGTEAGEGHYYRLQGPTFLVEYDNTQNNANHIHTVWRDFANDFGADLLRKHVREDHGQK